MDQKKAILARLQATRPAAALLGASLEKGTLPAWHVVRRPYPRQYR
jgi:hypothetical protein